MAEKYITSQGETWDSIAYDQYGDEGYMKLLVEANWPLLETLVFSAGTEIVLPDLPEEADQDLPFWRNMEDDTEDDDDTDVETDEDVAEDDEDDEDTEEEDDYSDDESEDEE